MKIMGRRETPENLARNAAAIVGAPMTPVSVARVAHRTTRHTGAVASSTSVASSAAAQQWAYAAPPPPAAAAPAGAPPVGSAATALPSGCVPTPLNGVEYERGGTTYDRARCGSHHV